MKHLKSRGSNDKPYGNTVKPNDMTKKQQQRILTQFFIKEIANIIYSNGHYPLNALNQVMRAFDSVCIPSDDADKTITMELGDIELSLLNREFYEASRSAKRIKEVLRDCNMWTIKD